MPDPTTTTPPIEVSPTTLPDQLFALMRQLTLVIGGFYSLLGFLKVQDIQGALDFVRDNNFVTSVVAVTTLAALVYGNLKTLWNKKKLIITSRAAPNKVAVVVE